MQDHYAQSPLGDRLPAPDGSQRSILLLGGTSLVAAYLVPRITAASLRLRVVARRPAAVPRGAEPFARLEAPEWRLDDGTVVLSLLPLPALMGYLPRLLSAGKIVALSSTSRFSKASSPDVAERAHAEALVRAEEELARWCDARHMRFTVLRPTLVYDMVRDRNLARMARLVRRLGVLPLAWPANGLRQPIHADDVGRAMLAAVDDAASDGRMLNIAGGERLTYRAMAERVFVSQGRRPRFVLLPVPVLRSAFALARRFGIVSGPVNASAFDRMNQDLVFDHDDGSAVLGLTPRSFDPAGPTRPGDLDADSIADPLASGG